MRISEARPAVVDRVITLSEQERNESWWTANDFAAVKDSVKRQCRDHRKSRRYSDCLTDAYAKACVMAAETDDGPQHQQVEDVPTQPEAEDVATTTTADSPDDGAKGSLVEISPPQEGQSEADEPDEVSGRDAMSFFSSLFLLTVAPPLRVNVGSSSVARRRRS